MKSAKYKGWLKTMLTAKERNKDERRVTENEDTAGSIEGTETQKYCWIYDPRKSGEKTEVSVSGMLEFEIFNDVTDIESDSSRVKSRA